LRAAVRAEQAKLHERAAGRSAGGGGPGGSRAGRQAGKPRTGPAGPGRVVRCAPDGRARCCVFMSVRGDVLGPQAKQTGDACSAPPGRAWSGPRFETGVRGPRDGRPARADSGRYAGGGTAGAGKVLRCLRLYTQRRSSCRTPCSSTTCGRLGVHHPVEAGQPALRIGQRVRVTLRVMSARSISLRLGSRRGLLGPASRWHCPIGISTNHVACLPARSRGFPRQRY